MVSFWIPMVLGAALFVTLFIVPVTATFAGERLDCGSAAWKFLPVDPGGIEDPEYQQFIACRAAGVANVAGVLGLGLATMVAGIVHGRIYDRHMSPST